MKHINFLKILIMVAFFITATVSGQTTIYSEDFSGQDGKGAVGTGSSTPHNIDISGVNWSINIDNISLTATSDWFKVTNEVFEARDIDGAGVWLSPVIDISGYTNVEFSLDASEAGGMETSDIFKTEYTVNGGTTWLVASTNGNLNDDFTSKTVSQNNLSGSNFQIKVTMNNGAGSEYHRLDNIVVQGISASGNPAPQVTSVSSSPTNPTSSDTVTVTADITDADGIASATLKYGFSSGSLTNSVNMTNTSGNTYSGNIPTASDGITVYYTVTATDSNGSPETTTSSEMSYTVFDPLAATLPYELNVLTTDPTLNNWTTINITSASEVWSWTNGTGIRMNGYNGSCKANEDWLVSPMFDLSGTNQETISFDLKQAYGSSNLQVLYATDYTGDVSTATWTTLETIATQSSNGTEVTISSSSTLENVNSSTVTFAVKYVSSSSNCARWTIENITIKEPIIWNGSIDTSWLAPGNWQNAMPPSATDNVIISSGSINYPTLTTPTTVNNLMIESGASLIAQDAFTGTVTYKRNLATTNWYLVSSPVNGENMTDMRANNNFSTNTGNEISFAPYDNSQAVADNRWDYFSNSATNTLVNGKGYATKLASSGDISFIGTINTSDVSIALTQGGANGNNFNLLGNPFTAYINSATFLTNETGNLNSETIWVWNQTTNSYETKVTTDNFKIAPAQGFFVEASSTNNVTFAKTMQSHESADTFQRNSKPEVHVFVSNGTDTRFAKLYYINGTTTGFDNGFDGKLFDGVANEFAVYTHLASNSQGTDFQVQSLPNDNYENMTIPVGLNAKANQEITFSSQTMNLPNGIKVYLEDRTNGTFTNLSENNYKITLNTDANGIGQFYLHTTTLQALSIDTVKQQLENVSVYQKNDKLTIAGLQTNKATLNVFSVLGKKVLSTTFKSNGVKTVDLPKLNTGVYIVNITSSLGKVSKKIMLK